MGLTKAIPANTGQSGDYWNIRSYTDDSFFGRVLVTLAQYKDRATRDAAAPGNQPMRVFELEFIGTDYSSNLGVANLNLVSKNPKNQLYPLIKAQALVQVGVDLSDAVDDV